MALVAEQRAARAAAPVDSSLARKIAMALSGAILILFVAGHFIGNLKVFQGPEAFNHYAEGLRTFGAPFFGRGQLLWLIRIGLLVALVIHVAAAWKLTLQSRRARPTRYHKFESLVLHNASRAMGWGGVTILAFVIYHLLHLTLGTVHPDFVTGDAYHNFISGFRVWPVSLAYILAMIPLGLHLYHGVWSACQTLGVSDARGDRWRRRTALIIALLVAGGNSVFPLAVLAGILN
jgi:succinate dehydrogenase / fumarate reductase cytochrome b subunit